MSRVTSCPSSSILNLKGLPRLVVPRMVPPRGRMPLTSFSVSSKDFSGQMRPSKPSGMPMTFHLYLRIAALVAARMTALSPGASPPPVAMPMQAMSDIHFHYDHTVSRSHERNLRNDVSKSRNSADALPGFTSQSRFPLWANLPPPARIVVFGGRDWESICHGIPVVRHCFIHESVHDYFAGRNRGRAGCGTHYFRSGSGFQRTR